MSAMPRRGCTPPRSSLTAAAFLVCAAGAAPAAEFESDGSSVRIDTTISHGLMFRVADRDDSLTSVNSDDGARNYSRGLVSNTSRIVSEIDIDRGAFGAFARVHHSVLPRPENRQGVARTEGARGQAARSAQANRDGNGAVGGRRAAMGLGPPRRLRRNPERDSGKRQGSPETVTKGTCDGQEAIR